MNESNYIVTAHLPKDLSNKDVLPAEWMRGTKRQCDAKAADWRGLYRSVQVLKLAD